MSGVLSPTISGILLLAGKGSRVEWCELTEGWRCYVTVTKFRANGSVRTNTVAQALGRTGKEAASNLLSVMWGIP